jgi:hypothetical protein
MLPINLKPNPFKRHVVGKVKTFCLLPIVVISAIVMSGVLYSHLVDMTDCRDGGGDALASLFSTSFRLAEIESNSFFTDIPKEEWKMIKSIAHNVQPNSCCSPEERKARGRDPFGEVSQQEWFQDNYEPELSCRQEVRIGRKGDGGKWVCDPHRIAKKSECLVYSVGSAGNAAFEAALLKEVSPECEIHVFDFDDFAQTTAEQTGHSKTVFYHQWGLSGQTGGRYKSFKDTVAELGHINRTIDIFKIDCEGCEFDTFRAWLDAPVVIQQILVEVHGTGDRAHDFFKTLQETGYAIFHKEPNIQYQTHGMCVEYCFLLLSPQFWIRPTPSNQPANQPPLCSHPTNQPTNQPANQSLRHS